MTKKAHRREQALFAPEKPTSRRPWRDDPYAAAHRTALDTARDDLLPPGRTVDDPRNHPRRSDELATAEAMVALRLADRADGIVWVTRQDADGDEVDDPIATFAGFGFTPQEARVWQLHLLGFSVETIRQFLPLEKPELSNNGHLAPETVKAYVKRARAKVRRVTGK